ncbi:dihydrolipoamide acetyltransferase family protein [Alteriqipengyuania flavescens]|uniref:dihydrolipoamide acetyltransferase family protein n=1 Tax=Alteriqipengyuania flavescens TaxID=3053610 RepID=UPI0025B5C6B1|nr:dihydrolipoamide acetyltransferase family protein [Alteriqipengyuania flavescens]WJY18436.1 dihydrolipoamide acetyltransferase family protein [Alteriqipengyuania flavescens]WJY24377.1 dihydrolipoamide acetyltransferase family protein [Alteriqipengyuania flavescens]
MARYTFNLPDIGEGIAEAEIVAWHVKVGDMVEEDDQLADMMTDKATVEMEAPVSGKVLEVAGEVGDTISIGSMLVVLEIEGDPDEVDDSSQEAAAPAPKAEAVEERIEVETSDASDADDAMAADPAAPAKAEPTPAPAPAPAPKQDAKVLASPAVRKRAEDLGIDLAQVRPAEGGRIRHGDLDQFIAYDSGGIEAPGTRRASEEVKVIGLRKRIAQNMAAAKRNIPHFSYVEEVDVTELEHLRAQLNDQRGDRPKLTMLPLLITAITKTLPDYPMINATYDDEAGVVTRHGSVQLGMAAQTDSGLMVPVIRNAESKNLWQLAREIMRLAKGARDGKLKSEELSGSTLTVTSLGPLGGVATTPVINRPEVAIIGPNRIIERPMYVKGTDGVERIEKRKLMNISISCDHRVVDGYDAASFVQDLKRLIEAPARILAG